MANVMPHARWMKLTDGGFTSIRSSQLKAVDAALLRYHQAATPANLDALQKALAGWMMKEGAGWKASKRNKLNAVQDLYDQIHGLGGAAPTAAERIALSHVRDESRAIVTDLFKGQRLEWRTEKWRERLAQQQRPFLLGVRSAVSNANTLGGGAIYRAPGAAAHAVRGAVGGGGGGGGDANGWAARLVHEITPGEIKSEVLGALGQLMPSFMSELAKSLAPFVGVLSTGASVLVSTGQLIRAEYRTTQATMHFERSLAVAEPARAIEGVIRLLDRERNLAAFDVTRGVLECGGKLAGVLADGGTATNAAIGLASAVAKLINILRVVIRDVYERRAANALMLSPTITGKQLFETSPLLGAYMILCVPTSVMVNSIYDHFFEGGWRGEVERTVQRHHAPLKEQARRLVEENRFFIPSLMMFPGMLKVNQKKLDEMMARKGKSGMVGFGSDGSSRP